MTESDLRVLKDLINQKFTDFDRKFTDFDNKIIRLQDTLNEFIIEQKQHNGKVDGKFETLETTNKQVYDLSEKVGELKNWKGIAFIILTAVGSSFLTWFLKK